MDGETISVIADEQENINLTIHTSQCYGDI